MKNLAATVFLCVLSIALSAGNAASATDSVEDQIKKLEQDWAHAIMTEGGAAVDKYEADDIVSTDPGGRVTDKTQDKKDLSSGDLKFQALEVSDVKVRVYGNTAVATGTDSLKGTYKEQDISGQYRFSDTWVKRNGKWQVVATQATKIQQ